MCKEHQQLHFQHYCTYNMCVAYFALLCVLAHTDTQTHTHTHTYIYKHYTYVYSNPLSLTHLAWMIVTAVNFLHQPGTCLLPQLCNVLAHLIYN